MKTILAILIFGMFSLVNAFADDAVVAVVGNDPKAPQSTNQNPKDNAQVKDDSKAKDGSQANASEDVFFGSPVPGGNQAPLAPGK